MSATGSASQPIDAAAVALGGAAGAPVPLGEDGSELVPLRRGRALVVVALDGDGRADPLRDRAPHDDDAPSRAQEGVDPVADLHPRRRLDGLAVDRHVPTTDGRGRVAAGLREPNGVEPLVDPHRVGPVGSDGFTVVAVDAFRVDVTSVG